MQRLMLAVGLVAAAVMLQGCGEQLAQMQAAADHAIAIEAACRTAVSAQPAVAKYETDSKTYCDTKGNVLESGICSTKRHGYKATCIGPWYIACGQSNSATVMNATVIEAAVEAYIASSKTEFETELSKCLDESLVWLKPATQQSRLYDATKKPKAAEAQILATEKSKGAEAQAFSFAMTGFIVTMVVGSVAFGVKRFVQGHMSSDQSEETDQEAGGLE